MKVKSHIGMPLNERADQMADVSPSGTTAVVQVEAVATMPIRLRRRPGDEPGAGDKDGEGGPGPSRQGRTRPGGGTSKPDGNSDTQWSCHPQEVRRLVHQVVHERVDELVQASDTIWNQFVLRGPVAEPALACQAHLSSPQTRVWYQLSAGIYPTYTYLARIGLQPTPNCPFGCPYMPVETAGHFLCRCPAFHDARTKAHDSAWEETLQLLTAQLPSTEQVFVNTPLQALPLQFTVVS